ncbi:MAG: amidohydrolase family protein, partial [Rhodoferax sp.]
VSPSTSHSTSTCCWIAGMFTGLLAARTAAAQPTATTPEVGRIDLHHHILPPEYIAQMGEKRIGAPAPNGLTPRWSVSQSIEAMDRQGISKAIVSISAPGVWLGERTASVKLARACNEFAAKMVSDHPARFGFFACLPLPDVKAALAELNYALDTLHADGVVLMSNYADRYLGDPAFAPIFEELNRRGAFVFVHPNDCSCNSTTGVPASVVDFPHDTTRAVTSLLYSGTLMRNPRIRMVLSHAGGTLPFLASRIVGAAAFVPGVSKEAAAGAMASLKSLYYDTALSVNPATMAALLKLVPSSQVVLGTDYPFAPEPFIVVGLTGLSQLGLRPEELAAVQGGTARVLLASTAQRKEQS